MLARMSRRKVQVVAGVAGLALAGAAIIAVRARRPRGFELSDEAKLLVANAKDPQVAVSLEAMALDPGEELSKRYIALRRLEDQAPACAVEIAEKLAAAPKPMLRANAIAVLARSHDPTAPAALARVRELSRANEALASQLASVAKKGAK